MRVRELERTERDFRAVAEIRIGGWRHAYRGLIPQEHLDGLSVDEQVRLWRRSAANGGPRRTHLLAADDDGAVVGWACTDAAEDEDAGPADRELFTLYVRPGRIGTGVGRALTREVLRRAEEASAAAGGPGALLVWVLEGNGLGRRFYERAGFTADGARKDFEVAGVTVPEIRYRLPLRGTP